MGEKIGRYLRSAMVAVGVGFISGIGFLLLKGLFISKVGYPSILIGTPVPLGGLPVFCMAGPLFGGIGALILWRFWKSPVSPIIAGILGGLIINLIMTPMGQ